MLWVLIIEASRRDASNEYQLICFNWAIRKYQQFSEGKGALSVESLYDSIVNDTVKGLLNLPVR